MKVVAASVHFWMGRLRERDLYRIRRRWSFFRKRVKPTLFHVLVVHRQSPPLREKGRTAGGKLDLWTLMFLHAVVGGNTCNMRMGSFTHGTVAAATVKKDSCSPQDTLMLNRVRPLDRKSSRSYGLMGRDLQCRISMFLNLGLIARNPPQQVGSVFLHVVNPLFDCLRYSGSIRAFCDFAFHDRYPGFGVAPCLLLATEVVETAHYALWSYFDAE